MPVAPVHVQIGHERVSARAQKHVARAVVSGARGGTELCGIFSRLLGKALPPMDCEELAWYAQQDAALQMRIRMLACFVADLRGTDRSRELPGACRGARRNRATFEEIVRCLVAPRSRAPGGLQDSAPLAAQPWQAPP